MPLKLFLSFIFPLVVFETVAQDTYVMKLNDTVLNVSLEKNYELTVNGQKINFSLSSKDTLTLTDTSFSFNYSKAYQVHKMQVDKDVEQYTIINPDGSGIILQKFCTLNPALITELMLNESTKKDINYGYQLKREDYKKTLKSGQVIPVARAVLRYNEKTNIIEVASIGKKDQGILIITMMIDMATVGDGKKIIDLFWDSLTYQ